MSDKNAELARQAHDALNRRDLPALLALMDADVEAVPRVAMIEGGYHGHDGIRRWWQHALDFLPDMVYDVVAVRDLGDLTVTTGRMRGHAAGSDTPLDQALWTTAEWRDGKCVWWGTYDTEAEAVQAVRPPVSSPRGWSRTIKDGAGRLSRCMERSSESQRWIRLTGGLPFAQSGSQGAPRSPWQL
jgi:ketosteroid isomerase-like protein